MGGVVLCAILLHGLGRSPASLNKMQHALMSRGYTVWNEGYDSTSATVEELSPVIDQGMRFCEEKGATRIDFVTHSMGGILWRHYFQNHSAAKVGAVVMLAPPNHGSEVVDRYRDSWWFRWGMGPAGQQLGTGPDSTKLAGMKDHLTVRAGHTFLMSSDEVIQQALYFLENRHFKEKRP